MAGIPHITIKPNKTHNDIQTEITIKQLDGTSVTVTHFSPSYATICDELDKIKEKIIEMDFNEQIGRIDFCTVIRNRGEGTKCTT